MRDPELVFKAQLAASALERAWQRWRVMHGLVADPMPAISSYVGYSLEEPWGQPRVVFGLSAKDAEQLAALLNRHDCIGPVHATIAGRQGVQAAGKLGAQAQAGQRAGQPLPVPPQAPSVVAEQSSAGDVRSAGKAKRPGIAAAAEPDGPVYRQVARAAREAARQAAAAKETMQSGQAPGPEVTQDAATPQAPAGQDSVAQKKSADRQPADRQSAAQQSAAVQSEAQKPEAQKSAPDRPATDRPAAERPAAERPATGQPAGQEPAGQALAGQTTPRPAPADQAGATVQAGATDQASGAGQSAHVARELAEAEKAQSTGPAREQADPRPATGEPAGEAARADQAREPGRRVPGGDVTGRPAADQAGQQQPGSAGQPAGQPERGEHPYPTQSARADGGGRGNSDDDPPAGPGGGGGSRPGAQAVAGGGRSRKARAAQSKGGGLTTRAECAGESSTLTRGSGVHSVAEGNGPGAGTDAGTRIPDEPGAQAHDSNARAETRDASVRAAEARAAELSPAGLSPAGLSPAEISATDAWADEIVRASHGGKAAGDAPAAGAEPAASTHAASTPAASTPAASTPADDMLAAGPAGQQADGPGPLAMAASAARVAAEARIKAAMRRSRSSATRARYATLDEAEAEADVVAGAFAMGEALPAVSVAGGRPGVASGAQARPSEEPLFGYEEDGELAAAWGGPVFSAEQAADPDVVPLRPRADDFEYADDEDLDPAADERPDHSPSAYARRNRISRGYGIPRLSRSKRPGAVPGL